jgi:hypothetical protein
MNIKTEEVSVTQDVDEDPSAVSCPTVMTEHEVRSLYLQL